MSDTKRWGYRDSRGGFIWPTSVICEKHLTQERANQITRLMLCYNTTAFPVQLTDSDKEQCVDCTEALIALEESVQ